MMAQTRYLIMPKVASHWTSRCGIWPASRPGCRSASYWAHYREKAPTYATTTSYDTVQTNVEVALAIKARGYNTCTLHPPSLPELGVEICNAVRAAVGPDYRLMLDPTSAYHYDQALRVGRAIEKLDFYWYEAPTSDSDLVGLTNLTRSFKIPITAGRERLTGACAPIRST